MRTLMLCGCLGLAIWVCLTQSAPGAVMTHSGPPQIDPDWPKGVNFILGLPTLVESSNGPAFGHVTCKFNGKSTADFQAALDAFAKIESPRLELCVIDDYTTPGTPPPPANRYEIGRPIYNYDMHWQLSLWNREGHERAQRGRGMIEGLPPVNRPMPPPRLMLYLGTMNPVVWEEVYVPENVSLIDGRVATSAHADSRGGVVTVTVRDMATSRPLAGATVEARRSDRQTSEVPGSAKTNEYGEAVIKDLPKGIYMILAGADGYATRRAGYYKNHGRTLGVYDDLTLSPASELHGRVVDEKGWVIEGVEIGVLETISLDGGDYNRGPNRGGITLTDREGKFTIKDLPCGFAWLQAKKPGHHYFSKEIRPVPGDEVIITMTILGRIHGRVSGLENVPAGRTLMIRYEAMGDPTGRPSGERAIGEDGTFAVEDLPADVYRLRPVLTARNPQAGGRLEYDFDAKEQVAKEMTVNKGEDVEVELRFEP